MKTYSKVNQAAADWLFKIRRTRGKSVREVVEGSGLSKSVIGGVESGDVQIKLVHFHTLCKYYKVDPVSFWNDPRVKSL